MSKLYWKNPNDANGYFKMGLILDEQGKIDEAIKNYEKAIKINGNHASAYHNLGIDYFDKGDTDLAVQNMVKSI